jgi:DNA-binding response OmpR family regulator
LPLFHPALGAVDDRVRGLRAGGDDYLTKPFAIQEDYRQAQRRDQRDARRSNGEGAIYRTRRVAASRFTC